MSVPKLPRGINPPQIPNSMRKGAEQQEPPKSNFFFIFMMTLLIIWSFNVFRSRDTDPIVPVQDRPLVVNNALPELTEKDRASLPKDFVENAERADFDVKPEFITLGSLDPQSPYRMLVTLTNRGAALTRVELNESAYADNSDPTGYMGQIVVDESLALDESRAGLRGVAIQAVGVGTPVAKVGLEKGDRIVSFTDSHGKTVEINEFLDLREALLKTKPGETVKIGVYPVKDLEKDPLYCAARLTVSKFYMNRSSVRNDLNDNNLAVRETGDNQEAVADNVTGTTVKDEVENKSADSVETKAVDSLADKTSENVPVEEEHKETRESAQVSTDTEQDEAELAIDSDKTELEETSSTQGEKVGASVSWGEPKIVEVQLTVAPLSVLRPSGIVRDYEDYRELIGLQGGYVDFGENEENYLRNKDVKGQHVRKLNTEPASFLTTLGSVDNERLVDWIPREAVDKRTANLSAPRSPMLDQELVGVGLRNGFWRYDADESCENVAVFKMSLLERRLEFVKKYELVQISSGKEKSKNNAGGDKESLVELGGGRAFHLKLSIQVRNYDATTGRTVSYLLDGPTGLPLEGAWFSSGRKTGPKMGAYGLRDVVSSINNRKTFSVIPCWNIAQGKSSLQSDEIKLDFLGVDGQYFQCTAIPDSSNESERFAYAPIRVGARIAEHMNFTDVSYRLKSSEQRLSPYGRDGDSFEQVFTVFIGPKQRDVMSDYGLSKTIVYGWFWFVSIPLLWILHFFHDYLVFNYGIAIMLLTILVRLCLFPLSRKQVLSSMKMQLLQPEIAALKEKYKDNPQEMMAAQQALFKKYGVNPLSGCLPIFIQMPIFIGLYRALSIDVNLYGAPLFTKSVRWCSNLAAPDMAFDWSSFWNSIGWESFNMSGRGFLSMFCLGPYLNILPIVTIALFLIQQKLLVPPVVGDDEQARQQRSMRRMMNFMMIFMGFMFFKVPSGLCVYFIVSSLWGLLERKLTPKKQVELVPVASGSKIATGSFSNVQSARQGRRASRNVQNSGNRGSNKQSLRDWWNDLVEQAKEQQRLAKVESSNRSRNNRGNDKTKRGKR